LGCCSRQSAVAVGASHLVGPAVGCQVIQHTAASAVHTLAQLALLLLLLLWLWL
jgi:hypothetical protein